MRIYLGVLKENSYTINLYRTLETYTDGTIGDPEIDYIALRSVDPIASKPANISYTVP